MKKTILITLSIIVLIALGAGGFLLVKRNCEKTVVIGASIPLSGEAGVYGAKAQELIKAYLDEFKSEDRFFKYKVVYKDNKFDNELNHQEVEKMVLNKKVNWMLTIVPFLDSTKELPDLDTMTYSIVAIEPSAQAQANDLFQGLKNYGLDKVDILVANYNEPVLVKKYLEELIKNDGTITIGQYHYLDTTTSDMNELFTTIKGTDAKAVMVFTDLKTLESMSEPYKAHDLKVPFIAVETNPYFKSGKFEEDVTKIMQVLTETFETHKTKDFGTKLD